MADGRLNLEIAKRYVSAFFELAKEGGHIDAVEKDMDSISKIISESDDFNEMIESKLFRRREKADAVFSIGKKAKFSDITKNFLGLLALKQRLNILPEAIEVFKAKLLEHREEVEVFVTVADDLSEEQVQKLEKTLIKSLKCKSVRLQIYKDKEIIGGLLIKVGSTLIDNSVKSKINRLQNSLISNSHDTNVREVA